MTEQRRYSVRCCQCGTRGKMGTSLPPSGWLEVFVNPRAFPLGWEPAALVVRICPDCAVPDRPARHDLIPPRPPEENTP